MGLVKDIPRTVGREFQKLAYYLPRAIGFFLLAFVPVIGQVIWFMGMLMLAIQYMDYAFDNRKLILVAYFGCMHKVPF